MTRRRGFEVIAIAAALSACGGDQTGQSAVEVGGPAALAGSCHFAQAEICDEYADDDADGTSAGRCTAAGGTWSARQCALGERTGVCLSSPPAMRTYAYGAQAAAELSARCPAGKFIDIEGACERTSNNLCEEFLGSDAVPKATGQSCRQSGDVWTPGGRCPTDGRSASCARKPPASFTYAYGAAAAESLRGDCPPDRFTALSRPPPTVPDEDAGT
jgi:hypothetical protein